MLSINARRAGILSTSAIYIQTAHQDAPAISVDRKTNLLADQTIRGIRQEDLRLTAWTATAFVFGIGAVVIPSFDLPPMRKSLRLLIPIASGIISNFSYLESCNPKKDIVPDLKRDWQILGMPQARNIANLRLYKEYEESPFRSDPEIMNTVYNPGEGHYIRLRMKGVAYIAEEIRKKEGLQNLFVCMNNRSAVEKKIQDLLQNPGDQKCALIVPAYGSEDDPTHKIAVCIEKKQNRLQIAVVDSSASEEWSYGPIAGSLKKFCESKKIPATIFYSSVRREYAKYGCMVFALEDAVAFLQNPSFFHELRTEGKNSDDIHMISDLPKAHMIGTQSVSLLKKYVNNPKHETETPITGRKKNLEQYMEKYVIRIDGIEQNHYITKKNYLYLSHVVEACRTLSKEEYSSRIGQVLLS